VEDDWVQLEFDGVITTLQGWLGHVVRASAESGHPDKPIGLVHATGVLRASGAMFDPQGYDMDEYPFELHPVGDHLSGFTLDRAAFHDAILTRGGRLLITVASVVKVLSAARPV
jgi:hypothetical protein